MEDLEINDILIEKYLLEELPPEIYEKIKNQIEKDVELQRKLAELKKSNVSTVFTWSEVVR